MNLSIVSGSIRENGLTLRIARALHQALQQYESGQAHLIDLGQYDLPLWRNMYDRQANTDPAIDDLFRTFSVTDTFLFVSPEYNGSYSLALKNVIDFFGLDVFTRKVVGIATVSTGMLGGIRCALQLQQLALAVQAIPVPYMFMVAEAHKKILPDGTWVDTASKEAMYRFLEESIWYGHAIARAKQHKNSYSLPRR